MKLVRSQILDTMSLVSCAKDRHTDPFISTRIVRLIWDKVEDELGLYTHTWHYSNVGWIRDVR